MNQLHPFQSPQESGDRVSSRAIADTLGKEHKNVRRDIKKMLDEAGIDPLKLEHTYVDAMNRQQREYLLSPALVIAYKTTNMGMTERLKLGSLIEQAAQAAQDRRFARIESRMQALEHKAAFADKYELATGDHTISCIAKIIGWTERDLKTWLAREKVIYRDGTGRWLPRAEHQRAGRAGVKIGLKAMRAGTAVVFTPKGVKWICENIGAH